MMMQRKELPTKELKASATSQFRNSGVKSGVSLLDRAVIELAYKSSILRMSLDKPK